MRQRIRGRATARHIRGRRMDPVANLRDEWNQLHKAVARGSIKDTLAVLATESVDIDQGGGPGGLTPLMIAVSKGWAHIVEALLKRGANPSLADKYGVTALHLGALERNVTIVKMLTNAGADLEVVMGSDGLTALHVATGDDNPEAVRALIEAGANPDSQTPSGVTVGMGFLSLRAVTPLHVAAEKGRTGALRELLRAKANPAASAISTMGPLPYGTTAVPLDLAACGGHSDVVRELVEEVGIEGCDATNAGEQALHLAALSQHMDVMTILTRAGVRDAMGRILFGAAGLGREASVQFLLRQRRKESEMSVHAYTNSCDGSGMTPLLCSIDWCSSGSPRIVRLLVDAGADTTSTVRVTNLNGGVEYNDTPLAVTTSFLREKVVDGKPATEEQLHRLQAIRRLLLRIDAVHAVSWLWPSDAPSIVHAAERSCGPEPRMPPLSLTLPILNRRVKTRHVFVASLMRHSVKP